MSDTQYEREATIERRVAVERDEAFVALIGLRINAFWKPHRWLSLLLIAPRMVRELVSDPDSGLLGSRTVFGPGVRNVGFVQYWDSFASLREYARDGDRSRLPAWQDYYQNGTKEDAAVGVWHETYIVRPDEFETVYNNIPPHGLAACEDTEVVPASDQRDTAAGRMGHTDGSDAPPQAVQSE